MNFIDIIFIVIIAVMLYDGIKRGILVSIISVLKYIISIPVADYVSKHFNALVYEKYFREYAIEKINEKIINGAASSAETINSIRQTIDSLPDFLTNNIDLSSFDLFTAENAGAYVCDNMLEPVLLNGVRLILFLLVFIGIAMVFNIVILLLNKQRRKARKENKDGLLSKTNGAFGGVFGFVKGVLFTGVCSVVLLLISDLVSQTSSFHTFVSESFIINIVSKLL